MWMGLATLDVSLTSRPLYTERPMGKSIWFWPRAGLTPGKAEAVQTPGVVTGQGRPELTEFPESSPRAAKSSMVAPLPIEQLMDAESKPVPQPNLLLVAEIAA